MSCAHSKVTMITGYSHETHYEGSPSRASMGTYDAYIREVWLATRSLFYSSSQGGVLVYNAEQLDKVNAATVKFSNDVTDPKAQIIAGYSFTAGEACFAVCIAWSGPSLTCAQPLRCSLSYLKLSSTTDPAHPRAFSMISSLFPPSVKISAPGLSCRSFSPRLQVVLTILGKYHHTNEPNLR